MTARARWPNEPGVVGWDDERLPRLWQPERELAKTLSVGCAVCLLVTVVTCAGVLAMFGAVLSLKGMGIAAAAATTLGFLLGAVLGWRQVAVQVAEQRLLKRELSDQQLHDLLSLTKRVFKEEGWVLVEPVRILAGTKT